MLENCLHWNNMNVSDSLHGKQIYKDECAKCFATPLDQQGIDVCLKCFVGNCNEIHSKLHYQKSNHPLILNIKKIPKEKSQSVQITKLAIGKPGGIDSDTDNFYNEVHVFCYQCNSQLDHSKPDISSMVNSVLLAQSAYEQSAVQEWELELQPCEHTFLLDQTGAQKIADKGLAHCQECDLKSNLWLCLACGHLGCGRKNYDGSGGNNHGVEHFNQTGHGVNVKIGTITPEGKASIHCYHCDNEVLDNELAAHLKVIGIDVQSQVKTEKSIAEQELEANLNLTLSKVIEDGTTLIPVFGQQNTGMQNLGNTCYINSVIQVLFSQNDFMNKYIQNYEQHVKSCSKLGPDCFQCQIHKLAFGLQSGKYSQQKVAEKVFHDQMTQQEKKQVQEQNELYQDGIRPQLFKSLVGKGHPEFQTGQQQDAREYFSYLLDKIQKSEKQEKSCDPGQLFTFEMENRIQCQECKKVKYTIQKDNLLKLAIPVSSKCEKGTLVSLNDCLEGFFQDQFIEDAQCSSCNKKTLFSSRYRFINYPKVLGIMVQRQVNDEWVPKKLEVEMQVPYKEDEFLDLQSKYTSVTKGQLNQGETALDDGGNNQDQEEEPELDQNLLNQVIQMGIPENHAKHSLYRTGNSSADMAVAWYFENMGDESLNLPLRVQKSKASGKNDVPKELLDQMLVMGFPEKKCKQALKNCDMNIERATDWLFSHLDDPDEDEEEKEDDGDSVMHDSNIDSQFKCEKAGVYKLQSFITHLGSSIHAGHYVCHINKNVSLQGKPSQWVYFNDAKVAQTETPPFGKGYMYFFIKK